MQQKVNAIIEKQGMEEVTKKLNTIGHTLQIIIDGLTQPEGFDIRKGIHSVLSNSPFCLYSYYLLSFAIISLDGSTPP